MLKLVFKLMLFSLVFIFASITTEKLLGFYCGYTSHGSISFLCQFIQKIPLYLVLIMSILYSWNIKLKFSILAVFIPIPMFIFEILTRKITGISNQINPEIIDIFSYFIIQYSLPCLIVAIAISCSKQHDYN